MQWYGHTLDSFFSDWSYDKLKGNDLFVDEYSMAPNKWMNVIYDGYLKYDLKVVMSAKSIRPTQ